MRITQSITSSSTANIQHIRSVVEMPAIQMSASKGNSENKGRVIEFAGSESETAVLKMSQELVSILSSEYLRKWGKITKSLRRLASHVEKKRKAIGYDYSDYGLRLEAKDVMLQHVYETRVLSDPVIAKTISQLEEFFETNVQLKNTPVMKEIFFEKMWRDYFEDLVYESLEFGEFTEEFTAAGPNPIVKIKNLQDCLKRIRETQVRNLVFSNDLSEYFSTSEIFTIMKEVCKAGNKQIYIWNGKLLEMLGIEQFLNLVRELGKGWVRSLLLDNCKLWEILDRERMLLLVKTAGDSGIRSLCLYNNLLWKNIGVGIFDIIWQAGVSGIRSLDIWGNEMGLYFSEQEAVKNIRIAGKSWFKSLNLCDNTLCHEEVLAIEEVAKKYKITVYL